jgi:hypothetical protein
MIERIERHIREHSASWGVELPDSTRVRALLRANPEQDGIVRDISAGQVGTLIFWFRLGDRSPFLVSKIVSPSFTAYDIAECMNLQESANRRLGYSLFPRVYAVAEIGGARNIFMEAVSGPNYEIQLARAACGPERSVKSFQRVITQQFQELGTALRDLQTIAFAGTRVKWGAQAAAHARCFLELCPEAGAIVSDARIAAMAESIDTVDLPTHFVLTEDHLANYLPGPRAVDQLVPDIRGVCGRWPGPVSGLRILVAYFRASPVREAYADYSWLDALASCLFEDNRVEIAGGPVRRFVDNIGLGSASPRLVWAFVMGVFFMRACQELEFHAKNVIVKHLRSEFLEFTRDATRIGDALRSFAGGKIRGLVMPRLHRDHLDGEFRGRDHMNFFSPHAQMLTEFPSWVGPAVRLQRRIRERHERLYRVVRWISRSLLAKFRQLSEK